MLEGGKVFGHEGGGLYDVDKGNGCEAEQRRSFGWSKWRWRRRRLLNLQGLVARSRALGSCLVAMYPQCVSL